MSELQKLLRCIDSRDRYVIKPVCTLLKALVKTVESLQAVINTHIKQDNDSFSLDVRAVLLALGQHTPASDAENKEC